jgi:hypothetical protein
MIFNRGSVSDIEKYYSGTYLKFKETGDRIFRIVSVTPYHVRAEDVNGFDVWIDLNEDYTVDYIIPGRKVFQYNDRAAMLYRKPARQYFRGMHPENTGFAFLTADGAWKEHTLDFSIIESFVNKNDYVEPHRIWTDKYQTYSSCAIDDQVAVNQKGEIYFGNICIGTMVKKTMRAYFLPVYERECKHMFAGLNLTWEVKP